MGPYFGAILRVFIALKNKPRGHTVLALVCLDPQLHLTTSAAFVVEP